MTRRTIAIGILLGAGCAALSPAGHAGVQETEARAVLQEIRRRHSLPALGAAVVLNGRTVLVEAVGVRKAGNPTPVAPGDQFHLGSCTKSMTATMLATLVEERKLRWDQTVEELLPDLATRADPRLKRATLEQLLAHRAGLTGESWPEGMSFLDVHHLPGSPMQQRREYVRRLLAQKPVAPPGERFLYSNGGYTVAAAAAERLTATSWEELMRKRLFAPLRMRSAGFGAMGTAGKLDQPWQHLFQNGRAAPVPPGPLSDNPPAIGPGGTVHASLGDWARYLQAHLGRDPRILPRAAWDRLHTPRGGWDYAFGWGTTERDWGGGTVLTHTGSNNQNFAVVWMAPAKQFAVMAVTNEGGDPSEKACDEVCAAMIGRYLH